MNKGLRWHAQVRTRNGAVTTGLRIRAKDAAQAISRAQLKAYREYEKSTQGAHYTFVLSDWFVIYVGLHDADMNNIGKV